MAAIVTRTTNYYLHKVLLCHATKATTRFVEVETPFKGDDSTKKAKEALAGALAIVGVKASEVVVSVQDIKVEPRKKWLPDIIWNAIALDGEPTKEAVKAALERYLSAEAAEEAAEETAEETAD